MTDVSRRAAHWALVPPTAWMSFWIDGIPVPQGSMRSLGPHRMVHSNHKDLRPFREAVAYHAVAHRPPSWPSDAPYRVALAFHFTRPASSPKRNPPVHKATRPDVDKLVRAVLDGLTGIVYTDDARVVELFACKVFTDDGRPGVRVDIEALLA